MELDVAALGGRQVGMGEGTDRRGAVCLPGHEQMEEGKVEVDRRE